MNKTFVTTTSSSTPEALFSSRNCHKSVLESNFRIKPNHQIFTSLKGCLMALFLSLSLFGANGLSFAQKSTIASGNWNNAAIWSPAGVPTTGQNVVISAGHTVNLVSNTSIGTGSLTVNGTLNRANRSFTAASLSGASTGVITATASILTVGSGNASTTYAGKLSGTLSSGIALRKSGSGTLTLTGQSDFAAPFNSQSVFVTAGTLKLGVSNALPAGSYLAVSSGATCDLNGFNQTLAGASSFSSTSSPVPAVLTNSALTASALTIDMPEGDGGFSWEATMTGKINLVVNGSDITNNWYMLSGTGISFTGNTSVTGTVTLGLGTALSGDVSVDAGSKLALTGNSSCNKLTLGGVLQAAGTHGNTASSATFKNNTYFDNSDPSYANVLTSATGPANCWGSGVQPFYPGVQPNAIPVVTSDPLASPTTVEARARWGATGFEAVLFTPANPSPAGLNMNPAGTPVWNDGAARNFSLTYNSVSGTSVWSVDWNKDLSFGSGESVSSTSPGLANKGFDYLSIYVQGSTVTAPATGASVTVQNFNINGTGFGTYSSSNSDVVSVNYRNGAGIFGDITITGTITITGGTGTASERPRFYIKLGKPVAIPASNCWDNYVFNSQTCQWVNNGTQPPAPTGLACWQTANFNNTTCQWDVTGTQPPAKISIASGNWNNPAIWSPIGVPTICDNVVISSGHTLKLVDNVNINGTITVDGILDLTHLTLSAGSLSGTGVINGKRKFTPTTETNPVLYVGKNNSNSTFAGSINGNTFFVKEGSGTLTLTGTSTNGGVYTGETWIQGGTIRLGSDEALSDSTRIQLFSPTAVLDLNGYNETIGSVENRFPFTGGGSVTNSSPNFATLTMLCFLDGPELKAVISGNLNLVLAGNGGVSLTGENTYTGTTLIKSGSWKNISYTTASTKSFGNSSLVTIDGGNASFTAYSPVSLSNGLSIQNGGKLLCGANVTANTLVLDGVLQVAGTYGSSNSSASNKTNNYFAYIDPFYDPSDPLSEDNSFIPTGILTVLSGGCLQPPPPTGLACWQTATFNNSTCQWDVTGTQPPQPPVVNCWDNFVFNSNSCSWINTGDPNFTNMVATPTNSPSSYCLFSAGSVVTHTTTGATGIGTATGLPAGITASWANNEITIIGAPTDFGTFNYSIPLTGGCGSVVATGTITVIVPEQGDVEVPQFSPGTGDYTSAQFVNLSSPTPGAEIYYTTNGNVPIFSIPNNYTKLYTGPIAIGQTTKIIAVSKLGCSLSQIASADYRFAVPAIVATPVITPGTGTYAGAQTVTITVSTPGAAIYYTTTGNVPIIGTVYTKLYNPLNPPIVNSNTTVRAMGVKAGMVDSPEAVAFLSFSSTTPICATPEISPATGNYTSPQTVNITCSTPGSTIYYTTNGNEPLLNPFPNSFTSVYTGSFSLSILGTTTIRAMATAPGFLPSPITVSNITLSGGTPRQAVDQNISAQELVVAPNPSSGRFFISIPAEYRQESMNLQVWNTAGKLISISSHSVNAEGSEMISLEDQPQGIYLLKVQTGGMQKTFRLVKN